MKAGDKVRVRLKVEAIKGGFWDPLVASRVNNRPGIVVEVKEHTWPAKANEPRSVLVAFTDGGPTAQRWFFPRELEARDDE